MKLISWNTNGLRGTVKAGLFAPLFNPPAGGNPDIVCLQETKCTPEQLPIEVVNIPGYHSYFSSPKLKKGYSGVAIYTREKPLSVSENFSEEILKKYDMSGDKYGDPTLEGRILAIELEGFYLINVYTPNSKGDLSRLSLREKLWDRAFLEYCQVLGKMKPVIFCGDLNVAHAEIDLARPKENEGNHGFTKEERAGVDRIIEAGFVDTFRHFYPDKKEAYTYWDQISRARERNVGWRIDYFFASSKLKPKLVDAKILADYLGSDHCPIELDLKI